MADGLGKDHPPPFENAGMSPFLAVLAIVAIIVAAIAVAAFALLSWGTSKDEDRK